MTCFTHSLAGQLRSYILKTSSSGSQKLSSFTHFVLKFCPCSFHIFCQFSWGWKTGNSNFSLLKCRVKVIGMDWNGWSTLKQQQGGTSLMVKFSKVFDKDANRRSLNHIRILLSKEILLRKNIVNLVILIVLCWQLNVKIYTFSYGIGFYSLIN